MVSNLPRVVLRDRTNVVGTEASACDASRDNVGGEGVAAKQ